MTEPASKVVPIKSEPAGKPARGAHAADKPRAPATIAAVAPRGAELVREQARLAQIEADIAILAAELEGLLERKNELELVAQASRAKIVVLEQPDIGGAS